jgi:HKD family nuclease
VFSVYNQTVACRFGVEFSDLLLNFGWTRLDVAVAWVRRSGMRHLLPGLIDFLKRGGEGRFIVGIDIENTSKEGLEDLLSLENHGRIQTIVNHNEHRSVTFHPKVYLFSNKKRACLIVGSNNLTASGLYTNTEAGLQVDAAVSQPVISQMRAAIDSWADTADNLARILDNDLLIALEQQGYVVSEDTLRRRRSAARSRSTARAGTASARAILFSSKPETAPRLPGVTSTNARTQQRRQSTAPTSGAGTVLLMRPRLSRGTQMQIPIPLKQGLFLNAVNEFVSDHDGTVRVISATRPERGGGAVNTYKLELPEGGSIPNAVLRIWRGEDNRVRYRVFGPNSAQGQFILRRLEQGRHTVPPATTVTRPRDPRRSTWYRFV